jgi:hypothetical protein
MNHGYRILLIGVFCLGLSGLVGAATPELVNYQARLTEPDGEPIDDTVDIVFTIYDAAAGGAILWQENHTQVSIIEGLFEIILGGGAPPVPLTAEVFATAGAWLGVQIGTDPEMSPRTRLVAVPYAQRVNTIDQSEGGQILGPITVNSNPNKDFDAAAGKLIVKGNADDSVVISPDDDIVISGTNNAGDDAILITAGTDGGFFQVTASDAAKATSRTVQIDPGQGVLLKGTEANGDDVILITAGESGGFFQVTASDAAKGISRTVTIDPAQGVLLKGTEASGDDAILITAGTEGGSIQITASDAAKAINRTVEINPSENIVLRATESNQDDVVLITANETGGSILVTASDAAKADPNTIVGSVIINENGIFIVNDQTSDTTLAITADGDITGDGQIAMGENSDNTGYGSSVLGLSNTASGNYSTVAGGEFNDIQSDYSAILGGYADTIFVGADYSFLFGIGSTLYADSTFMVDMPHIRFGDETTGYEFPTSDGAGGQVLATNGAGQLSWTDADFSGGDGIWFRDGLTVSLANLGDSVSIGTVDPTEKFEVDGNIRATGSVLVGDDINFNGLTAEILSESELAITVPEGLYISGENQGEMLNPSILINTSTGAYLSGDGIWVNASGPANAEDVGGVAQDELLEKLASLPIKRWNSSNGSGTEHIGPLSADLMAIFGIGDGKTVSTVDPAGIALAAIQALYQKTKALEERSQELEQLRSEITEMKAQLQQLLAKRN